MEEILSVGIDIGTSTTQVVFSRFTLDDTAGFFAAPNIRILEKRVVYKSEIHLTPLRDETRIDGAAIRSIVAGEYEKAGIRPADVATGAVIMTGESARKENAAEVLAQISDFAGEFVVSTAGPDLESAIAGKGSGAFAYSAEHECVTVNLDVGGGTTNLARFNHGEIDAVGCLDVGGRLIRLDREGAVLSVSPAAALVAEAIGVTLAPGARPGTESLRRITDEMANLLAQLLGLLPRQPLLGKVKTLGSSDYPADRLPQRIFFSGGVAACMAARTSELFAFGDVGVLLARSIQSVFSALPCVFEPGRETVRATVVGAGTYTTTLSGSTISYSNGMFPIKNLPVLKLTSAEQTDCLHGGTELLSARVRWFLRQNDARRLALVLEGVRDPDYRSLQLLARSLSAVLDGLLAPGEPIVVSVERDMAKALGNAIHRLVPGRKAAVIDSVHVGQNDYLDIGRPLANGLVVPVVVKTLLFG